MVEQNLLLALMRRLRRRRRWTDAFKGSAVGLAVVAPVLAVATAILHRAGAAGPAPRQLAGALVVAAAFGAGARLARGISLAACARANDRVFAIARVSAAGQSSAGQSSSDDCMLAAVALAEEPRTPTAFLRALTAEAMTRAQSISPRRAVPPPAPRLLMLAAAGVGLVAIATFVPLSSSGREASLRTGGSVPGSSIRSGAPPTNAASLLRLDEIALASERADERLAAVAAREAADQDLARLARTFHDLLDDFARDGVDAGSAMTRLRKLADEGRLAAELSNAARTAGQAATRALGAALDVGTDGKTLAAAIAAPPGAADSAGPGAARLANRSDAGRAALGRSAEAAAAGLTGLLAADSSSSSQSSSSSSRAGQGQRRLDQGRPSPSRSSDQATPGVHETDGQRRLEQLRRDLEETASGCKTDPEACTRRAGDAGRGLASLHREGQTAQARRRLADATRQLLDRISRGDTSSRDRAQLMRFARAARGSAPAEAAGAAPNSDGSTQAAGEPAEPGWLPRRQSETGDSVEAEPHASGAAGEGPGVGAPAEGGGIGSEPGGPLLGPRQAGGAPAGHDVAARLPDDAPGPSRATIIGDAAARGFATAGYRRLFDDYHAAVEESLDLTAVPPGQRYLVRRYFQLIRPVSR